MMTSWSLNCSRMSSQMGVGGSSGSAFLPCCARSAETCCAERPLSSVTSKCWSASAGVLVNALSMPR
jgi:hypothetical protein